MRFRNAFRYMAVLLMVCFFAVQLPMYAQPKGWEQVRSERSESKKVAMDQDVVVKVASNVVIITSTRSVQVKIFTILGRVVSSETLPAGTYQFQLPSHGIYMVKVGDITCKVAV